MAEQLANRVILAPDPPAKNLANAFLTRGLARGQLGRPFEAVGDFTQAINLKAFGPDDLARVYFDRGVTYDGMAQIAEAISDYSAALKLVPQFPAALNNRANAYRRSGQLAEAKADYDASLAAGNSSPEYSYYGLGQIAEASGDVNGACDFYRRALKANPDYGLASKRLLELGHPWTPDAYALRPPREKLAFVPKPIKLEKPKVIPVDSKPPKPSLRPALAEIKTAAMSANIPASSKPERASASLLQLGSFRSEQAANAAWKTFEVTAAEQLKGLSPQVVAVDIPGRGRWYRLRTGPVTSAKTICAQLSAKSLACIVVGK
ncbi:MAG: tetratricopeptide repeat protein [Proteobacteria bacterium]|nr:tetratricopeptide repeat protein [Pseudomonadota bacterium]